MRPWPSEKTKGIRNICKLASLVENAVDVEGSTQSIVDKATELGGPGKSGLAEVWGELLPKLVGTAGSRKYSATDSDSVDYDDRSPKLS